jgi:hypothetical protein
MMKKIAQPPILNSETSFEGIELKELSGLQIIALANSRDKRFRRQLNLFLVGLESLHNKFPPLVLDESRGIDRAHTEYSFLAFERACGLEESLPRSSEHNYNEANMLRWSAFFSHYYSLEPIKALPKDQAIIEVKKKQDQKEYDFIWQLFTYYETDYLSQENPEDAQNPLPPKNEYALTLEELYELANAVSPENPHYKEAQSKCAHILMQAEVPEDIEEKDTFLKLKFKHAGQSGDKRLRDLLFAELCGLPFGEVLVENVQPNYETLFALAKVVKDLNGASQKREIADLSQRFFKAL